MKRNNMSATWSSALASGPGSPLSDNENIWLFDCNFASHSTTDLLASLPLSAVLPDKSVYTDSPLDHIIDDGSASPSLSFYDGPSGPESPIDTKPSRAELASKLLNELDELKEEPFSEWLEEKIELPIFEDFSASVPVPVQDLQTVYQYAPRAVVVPPPVQPAQLAVDNTEALLMEFESVYGAIEGTHLTPPQSPPTVYAQSLDARPATQFLLALQAPYAQPVTYATPQAPQPLLRQYESTKWTPPKINLDTVPEPINIITPSEIEQELAVFDELVRSHSGEHESALAEPIYAEPPSPGSTTTSSYASSEADDEWASSNDRRKSRCGPKSSGRSKPYSRNTEDKRSRKKEQNKNAATRYRLKKKAETEVIVNEERGLRERHSQLDTKCTDLQREIKYLKGLMRDLFKAKGLIK